MSRRYIYCSIAAVVALVWSSCLAAATPELKYLNPPGAQRGATVAIAAVGKFEPWPVQAWISGDGVKITPAKEKGKFEVAVDADAAAGVRWVRLHNADGASTVRPFIIGGIKEAAEKETNDLATAPQEVGSEPTLINGALAKSGDVDCYRVALARGQTFIASLDAHERLGSPIDAVLQVVRDGHVVAQSHDDRGLDPRLVFAVPSDGEYVVRVFAFASTPNSSIRYHGSADSLYRLTLTTGPLVEQAFPLAVKQGEKFGASPEGFNLPNLKRIEDIAQRDVATQRLPLPSGIGGDAEVVVVDTSVGIETEPNDRDAAQRIVVPISVSGRIDASGDRDAFVFAAKKGETWRVRVRSLSLGFNADPLLIVEGADGKQLLRSDDVARGNSDADTTLKATADGDYRIVVEDLFGAVGPRHRYLLEVIKPDADFALSTAAGEFVAAIGKTLEIPVTIERPAGMTSDIEVQVEGLPKSGEAKAVSMGKGETSKKVTLKFTPKEAFAGPIRIVGTTKAPATVVRRTATATVANVPRGKIADLWLTITGK